MEEIRGKSVVSAIARGTIVYYQKNEITVEKRRIKNAVREMETYLEAKESVEEQLDELYAEALERLGEENAQIFIIHKMLLSDNQFEQKVEKHIKVDYLCAEYAVSRAAIELADVLRANSSDYVKERAADVRDVSDRLIRHIMNVPSVDVVLGENSIICTDDIMPSEAMMFDRSKIAGFCTAAGAVNSHASILARSMNIPCIVCMGDRIGEHLHGREAIVDGYEGALYISPDEMTIRLAEEKIKSEQRKLELLTKLVGLSSETVDGRKVRICANIYNIAENETAVLNDAEGVGVFSTESLYLGSSTLPSEDMMFYNFRRVAEDMQGREVSFMTCDMSAEKAAEIFDLKKEQNPALGFKSIRVCLEQQEFFKSQISAMLRASAYGKISIVIPMIIDIGEFRYARSIINEVKDKLREEGVPFDENVKTGVMIETPAAVMTSDILAKEADFFSIGTNDLEQYTLALDKSSYKYDRVRPENNIALLRMIKLVCDNAHKNGIKIILCGEIASDFSMTETFLQMNVDAFSVTPSRILPLRKVIRGLDLGDDDRTQSVIAQALSL